MLPFSRLTGAFGWMRENSSMRLWPQSGSAAASPSRMTMRVASTISACTHTERNVACCQFQSLACGNQTDSMCIPLLRCLVQRDRQSPLCATFEIRSERQVGGRCRLTDFQACLPLRTLVR